MGVDLPGAEGVRQGLKHGDIQYRAFISYSHADRRLVEWLHRALESYRVPAKLVGQITPLGPVPARLGSLFRDRDELPAAGDLSTELKAALKRSMFLIVVCSPASAQSKWVNEEVRQFKLLHGHKRGDGTARVLALIADGDPGDAGLGNCFPPALRFHVLPDGSISDDPAEPVAADIRPSGDGRKLAKLKLVAGLTGLPLDALVQREAVRRQRRLGVLAGASLALTAVMAVLTVLAVQGRREAERQRAQADGLIEYMLTDLREKLEPVGRLEVLDSVGQKALAYYQAQDLDALDPDELGRRARALHLVGEVRDLRGDSEAALKAFREAERTTGELLARDPTNADRMFDHAQSVFWVGQTAWARRDWATAELRFRTYARLADAMAKTDPANPKWKAEQGYAANSLGALFRGRRQPREAITQFRRYVAITAELAAADPSDGNRQWEAGQAQAWLADALLMNGQLADARAARMKELGIYSAALSEDSGRADVRMAQGRTQEALAELDLLDGDAAVAIERTRVALEDLERALADDPGNRLWLELAVSAGNRRAEALALAGQWQEASRVNQWAMDRARMLVNEDPRSQNRQSLLRDSSWLDIAIRFGLGDRAGARARIADFLSTHIAPTDGGENADFKTSVILVLALSAADRRSQGDDAGARQQARQAAAMLGPAPDGREPAMIATLRSLFPDAGLPPVAPSNRYPGDRLLKAASAPTAP
jgi:tetratricopeptide (TPR) repeat protein